MPTFSIQPLPLNTSIQTVISDWILWAVFIGVMVMFTVFTWILVYHWHRFDFGRSLFTVQARVTYFVGSIVIIIGMVLSLITYLYG